MKWYQLLITVPFALIALALAYVAVLTWRQRRRILATPTTPMADVRAGLTEVQGVVSDLSTVVTSPLEGVPCVWWRVDVQQVSGKSGWKVVHQRSDQQRCLLSDGTGAVEVEVYDAAVNPAGENLQPFTDREAILEFLEAWPEGVDPERRVRCVEQRLHVGDPIFAIGIASLRDGDFPLIGGAPELELILHVGDEADLLRDRRSTMLITGLIAVVVGLMVAFVIRGIFIF